MPRQITQREILADPNMKAAVEGIADRERRRALMDEAVDVATERRDELAAQPPQE